MNSTTARSSSAERFLISETTANSFSAVFKSLCQRQADLLHRDRLPGRVIGFVEGKFGKVVRLGISSQQPIAFKLLKSGLPPNGLIGIRFATNFRQAFQADVQCVNPVKFIVIRI